MMKKFLKLISILSLVAILLSSASLGAFSPPFTDEAIPVGSHYFKDLQLSQAQKVSTTEVRTVSADYRSLKLYLGGMPFGVKFLTDGILVVGFSDCEGGLNAAVRAGLRCNDIILSIDGKTLSSVLEMNELVNSSKGMPMKIGYSRNGKEYTTTLTPQYSNTEKRYVSGMQVRDSGAGIGTVTFICPETGAFAGLGHGICDGGTGELIPMQRGSVVDVKIHGVVKGLKGSPGEVKGYFNSGKLGTLLGNTHCGVYGVFARLPKEVPSKAMSIGLRDSVRNGKAYIYSMLDGDKVERYEIEISDIQRQSTSNKCFTVKVTDKRLINKTGGIIQGMSGSPIVQNGRIIGAVTHVMVNDPTVGYGIFIENMLNQMGDMIR